MTAKKRKTKAIAEFGDFQTPATLALVATDILVNLGISPRSIIEPTCGRGAFVSAAASRFPDAESIIGIDINQEYLNGAAQNLSDDRIELRPGNFFKVDWSSLISEAKGPWLILGNPPWVTSSELGAIASNNLPEKSNFQERTGIEAITGKSNFDISEWMLLQYLDWLEGSAGTIAVLCKTAVARKILLHIWKKSVPMLSARIYKIDAIGHFGAAVDAGFFVLHLDPNARAQHCDVFDSLDAQSPSHSLGFQDGHIISDVAAFNRHRALLGPERHYVWRSGVKHDCSKVMELNPSSDGYRNGVDETVALEDTFLFPMLKSSDIGNGRTHCRSVMLVTQRFVGEETASIKIKAPKTWDYLMRHAPLLSRRGSVIYKKKPQFSIFGVGAYTFAPWKVAISGFYKKLNFVKVDPVNGRPVVLDDTVNFLPCWSEEEACFIESLLRSSSAQEFLNSMIHWDEKRPITVDILKRLNISRLAAALDLEKEYALFTEPPELPLLRRQAGT